MAEFISNTPIETKTPWVEVTVNKEKPLPVGVHRFQLVVRDDSKNESLPQVLEIIIKDTKRPTAVIDIATVEGKPTGGPNQAEYGESFGLYGGRSSDVPPGRVVAYQWTLLPRTT